MRTISMERSHWNQHIIAGVVSLACVLFVFIDRRTPVDVISGEIIPRRVVAGTEITIRWHTNWFRQCEAISSREIIGSNMIIRSYMKESIRIPTSLGSQFSEIKVPISAIQPLGLTSYKTTLRFHDCGLTSRIFPIVIETPTVFFEVVKAP